MSAAAFVYLIQNILDGKIYIGKTTRPDTRWGNHLTYARNGSTKGYLYRAIRKHGEKSFSYSLIEEHPTEQEANEAERFFIAYFRSIGAKLYNATEGGEGTSGYKPPKEQIQRRVENARKSLKQAWKRPEVRVRHGRARQKLWANSEFRARHKEATNKGVSSPEAKKRSSISAIRTWSNPDLREKLMAANACSKSRFAKGDAASKRWKDPEHRKKAMASALNPTVLEAKRQASLRRWARYRRDNGLPRKPGDAQLLGQS
jgi:group I intron endonuclease